MPDTADSASTVMDRPVAHQAEARTEPASMPPRAPLAMPVQDLRTRPATRRDG
ncbi:glucosyltransferase MdoH, partial [Methylorubrum extorquens DSM 13060]